MSHYARFCKTVKGKANSSSRNGKTRSRGRGSKVATIKESGGVQGDGVVPVSGDLGSISGSQTPLPEGDFFSLSSTLCSDEASDGVGCRGVEGPCFGMPEPRACDPASGEAAMTVPTGLWRPWESPVTV